MGKYFTLETANRALVLLKPIIADIVRKMQEAHQLHQLVQQQKNTPGTSDVALLDNLSRAEKLLNEVEYHMKELEAVGVFLKDLEKGIVDFPCLRDGQIVYLCFRIDEESINFWHETSGSFTDRKPVDERFMATSKISA